MAFVTSIIAVILHNAGVALYYTWWIWVFILIVPLFEETWLFWRQELYKRKIDFVLLEMRMPREVRKSPMAMEQVLGAIHALRNIPRTFKDKWINGEVTLWYSLEIVSLGGEVHFYLRTFRRQQPLIEAAFFSYYPDVELVEVDEDYAEKLPSNITDLYAKGQDFWGTELLLAKDSAYPLKSYLDFESPEEEKQYDPISLFLEVLGKVKRDEFVGIQLLISPAGDEWRKNGEKVVDDLRSGKKEGGSGAKKGASLGLDFPHILPVFPVTKHEEKKEGQSSRTPGETNVLTAVEENIAKPGFETLIRFIYTSPKEQFFNGFARSGILGAFNQYASMDMNSFKPNAKLLASGKIWTMLNLFPERRSRLWKERLLAGYREREIPPKNEMGKMILSKFTNEENSEWIMLSSRSLATIFHPPTYLVLTAPHVKRLESRKAGPPAGLPIYGAEEDVEKYR